MTNKGASLIETLIGTSIAIGMLAVTLHIGTELQRKSSWEEEALSLHTVGMQMMQTLEEHLLNAGHGFGSTLLFAYARYAYEPVHGGHEHRYAMDIFPCKQDCQNGQNYGLYKNISQENLSDELFIHDIDSQYARNVVGKFKEGPSEQLPWRYVLGSQYVNFEWKWGWDYAIIDKSRTWGCAMPLRIDKVNGLDTVHFSVGREGFSIPCHYNDGTFTSKGNYENWRIGPLNNFAARIKFDTLGPSLEFPKAPGNLSTLSMHGSGRVGSDWRFPYYLEWFIVSRSVLSLKLALGIPDPAHPNQVLWFPDKEKNHPYISMCDESIDPESLTRCAELVYHHFGEFDEEQDVNYRHALMRRVRAVRVALIVQSKRADARKVEWDGNGAFVANADGTFMNGRLTKRFERTIWPPNLQETEAEIEEEEEEP